MRFDASYVENAVLADGTALTLRMIRPSDAQLLVEGFEHLSPESRYRRFLSVKSALTEAEIEYLTNCDGDEHLAIGALIDDHGVGVARFVRFTDRPEVADVAITVADDYQGRGIGTLLMNRLVSAAQEHCVQRLHFDELANNDPMLRMLRDIDPVVKVNIEGGVATAELEIL
jgi:GNAT superfamily N-acetyltransferase